MRAKFFGTGQQTAIGATTVVVDLDLRCGTGQAENKSITLRLDGPGRMVEVETFTFEVRTRKKGPARRWRVTSESSAAVLTTNCFLRHSAP